jgi:hypothetical protein
MKIGIDINLSVCRAEGYLMMEFNSKKLVKNGKLDKDCYVRFTATSGCLAWNDNGKLLPPQLRKTDAYILDVQYTFNDLLELYEQNKANIDSCCDYGNCKPDFENPTEYDMLNLASNIDCYYGINY